MSPRRSSTLAATAVLTCLAAPAAAQIVFQPPTAYAAPALVLDFRHVAVGDVDGDGVPDVVVSDGWFEDDVNLMRGSRDGTLQPSEPIANVLGDNVTLHDLDADDDLDLLTTFDGDIYVALGAGDGTFATPLLVHDTPKVVVLGHPQPMTLLVQTGDVTGDGVADLAVSQGPPLSGTELVVLPGNGDGTFGTAQHVASDSGQLGRPRPGDLDGDGHVDIVAGVSSPARVLSWLSDGQGGWTAGEIAFALPPGASLDLADVDGDGALDVVTPSHDHGVVMVALGLGDGTFAPSVAHGAGTTPRDVEVVDLDQDGALDIVTANLHSQDMTALRGSGDGAFELGVTVSGLANANLVLSADVDLDGFPDLVTGGASSFGDAVEVIVNHTYGEEQPFVDEGHASPGSSGFPIHLAWGALEAGEPVTFSLRNAAAGRPAWLVIGLSTANAPFKGGTLVPAPDLALGPFTVDGLGALDLGAVWPCGMPSGVRFHLQYWISDPGAGAGFAAGSAIAATTP